MIRTGATNIADYLAYIAKVPPVALGLGVTALLCVFAWASSRTRRKIDEASRALPKTGTAYWLAMLAAGAFGTLAGDLCSDNLGQAVSSLSLGAILALMLFGRGRNAAIAGLYWVTVAVARTAGTAMGDWMAENKIIDIGLAHSTLITGAAFVAVLLLWRSNVYECRRGKTHKVGSCRVHLYSPRIRKRAMHAPFYTIIWRLLKGSSGDLKVKSLCSKRSGAGKPFADRHGHQERSSVNDGAA